jgi:hypothetical protein
MSSGKGVGSLFATTGLEEAKRLPAPFQAIRREYVFSVPEFSE